MVVIPLLETQLGALNVALGEHLLAWRSGKCEALRVASIYGKHVDLLDAALVADLLDAVADDPALLPYLNAVTRIQIEGGCAPLKDKTYDTLAHEIIRDLSDKWYFRDTPGRVANQCNRKKRKVLDQSQRRVLARLESVLVEEQEAVHTLMVDRGFTGYQAMCEALTGIDYGALLEDLDGLLADSGKVYTTHLSVALREAGVFPDDARSHDVIYMWSGHYGLSRRYPERVPTVLDTLKKLGLDLSATERLTLTEGERPGAWPGVHVQSVGEQTHLLMGDSNHWHDWPDTFAAAGVALGRAMTDPDTPYAARHLRNPAVETAFGVLFASLPGNREWLNRYCPKLDVEAQVTRHHLWWLFNVRQLTGSLRYGRFLHGPGEMADKADSYEHFMHEACGLRMERDYYLWNTAPFFDPANTVRGHFLGAQLLNTVTERFGDGWFADAAAGAFLADLFAGGAVGADGIVDACDIDDAWDIWPLTERLEAVLGEFAGDD